MVAAIFTVSILSILEPFFTFKTGANINIAHSIPTLPSPLYGSDTFIFDSRNRPCYLSFRSRLYNPINLQDVLNNHRVNPIRGYVARQLISYTVLHDGDFMFYSYAHTPLNGGININNNNFFAIHVQNHSRILCDTLLIY